MIMARSLSRGQTTALPDIDDIGRILHDLSGPLTQLAAFAAATAREASRTVPERMSETLSELGTSVGYRARDVGEEAARFGRTALHRVEDEVTHRPLVALAIAAGIGFLIGAMNRR
jgi:ElaB/YqjD/DUF883 family membrane-anchored ribosome-binding protein